MFAGSLGPRLSCGKFPTKKSPVKRGVHPLGRIQRMPALGSSAGDAPRHPPTPPYVRIFPVRNRGDCNPRFQGHRRASGCGHRCGSKTRAPTPELAAVARIGFFRTKGPCKNKFGNSGLAFCPLASLLAPYPDPSGTGYARRSRLASGQDSGARIAEFIFARSLKSRFDTGAGGR